MAYCYCAGWGGGKTLTYGVAYVESPAKQKTNERSSKQNHMG